MELPDLRILTPRGGAKRQTQQGEVIESEIQNARHISEFGLCVVFYPEGMSGLSIVFRHVGNLQPVLSAPSSNREQCGAERTKVMDVSGTMPPLGHE